MSSNFFKEREIYSGGEEATVVSGGVRGVMTGDSTVHTVFRRNGHLTTGCKTRGMFSFDLKGPGIPTPRTMGGTVVRVLSRRSPVILRNCAGDGTNCRSIERTITSSLGRHFKAGFTSHGVAVAIKTTKNLGIVLGSLLGPNSRIIIFTPCFKRCEDCASGCSNIVIRVSPSARAFRPGVSRFRRGLSPGAGTIVIGAPGGPANIMCSRRAVRGLTTVLRGGRGRFKARVCLVSSRPCERLTCSKMRIPCLAGCCTGAIMKCSFDGSLSLPKRHVNCLIVPSRITSDRGLGTTTGITAEVLKFIGTPALRRGIIGTYLGRGASVSCCSEGERALCGKLGRLKFRYVGPRKTFCLFMGSPITSRGRFYGATGGCGVLVIPKDSFKYPKCIEVTCYMTCRAVMGTLPGFTRLTERCE